jgi:hypothetical protein
VCYNRDRERFCMCFEANSKVSGNTLATVVRSFMFEICMRIDIQNFRERDQAILKRASELDYDEIERPLNNLKSIYPHI